MLGHCHALLWLPVLLHLAQANSVSYPREKVSFIGRWWSEGGAMHASWGTAAFQVTFQGSSRLVAKLRPYRVKMYHTCRINGRETVLEHQTGDMVIATGLSTAETHTIWCGRNTEAFYGKTILEELLVDAGTQFLEPPSLDGQLRVEFIGDSITAGWVVLNSAGSYVNQNQTGEDIFQTWDRHLADAWGTADWRAVARTGVGVFPYQAYGIQFHAIQNRFLCSEYSASVCCPVPWDFAVWQADVVVINMGTNDHIPLNPSKPSAARFQGGYEELLTTVRAKYPGALILCLVPLIYTCDTGSRYNNMYQGLTDAVRAMEDEKIRLHTTGTREAPWLNCYADYVDGTHPTREGGQKFADRLLPSLTPDVRRFFPLKCGGTGPRCAQGPQGGKPTTLPPRQTTTRSTSIATTGTTSAGPAPGDAECCYPDCANSERVCNTEEQSPFCTSSAANCRSCGGELCTSGGGSPTTTPTVPTTLSSTIAATTTSEGTTSAGPAPGDAECCYPDCANSGRVCNTEEQSPFCTSSAANCRSCGGELCTGGGGSPTTTPTVPTTLSSTIAGTTTSEGTTSAGPAPGDAECCYPDCADSQRVCNTEEQSPFCTSSAANCRSCGGELCTGGRRDILP